MVKVRPCTVADLEAAPEFAALLEEYADESCIAGLPHPAAKMDMYHTMEAAGALDSFGAWQDAELVGLVVILSHVMPHYGVAASFTESFFVSPTHRKSGAGEKLRQAAEQAASARGSSGLFISAPHGGQLSRVLDLRSDYHQTNDVFFKRLP